MAKPPPRRRDEESTAELGLALASAQDDGPAASPVKFPTKIKEIGGPAGPEPTRYGDWERAGRCIDF
jgi:hypothetical protein